MTIFGHAGFAQNDTIIVYTPATQEIDTILPVSFDTTIAAAHAGSNTGSLIGQILLSNDIPVDDLWPDVNHTTLQMASDWFDVSENPMRAAVKLAVWNADTIESGCSGMIVSRSMVLTAAHCILDYSTGEFFDDGIVAFPG
jgi:V8-like Glu-specific endopeptidase